MTKTTSTHPDQGQILLNSVERLLDIASVERNIRCFRARTPSRREACKQLVGHYASYTAAAGVATALPALVPGWGTVVSLGLTAAELAFVMKIEVEMCLALCGVYGMDVHHRGTRQTALALAAVEIHRVEAGRNAALDLCEVGAQSILKYSPRELSKLIARIFGVIALRRAAEFAGKGLLHAIPAVGMVVGSSMNAMLTHRVGSAATLALVECAEQTRSSTA